MLPISDFPTHTFYRSLYIDSRIPQIENTGNTELEDRVNLEIQKVVRDCQAAGEERAKEYYDAFVETGGDPKDFIPLGITIDYETKYISPECVSFVVSQRETRFAAYNCDLYYNRHLAKIRCSGKIGA